MDSQTIKLILTSTVVSALVGGLVTLLSQQRLLARKAQLDYEFEAKKRLYEAVGPLRFQLLLAVRDVVRRFHAHHGINWNMDPNEYYVKSCIYRILAPLAVGQLIERQMSLVDFAVDKEAISLLSFVTAAERMLTGSDIVLNHPDLDWSSQTQHLFRDNLRSAADKLIVSEPGKPERVMSFAEFDQQYDLLKTESLRGLVRIFEHCQHSLTENPIFWVRMIGYTRVCSMHLQSRSAANLGFNAREIPVDEMIMATRDPHFMSQLNLFRHCLKGMLNDGI